MPALTLRDSQSIIACEDQQAITTAGFLHTVATLARKLPEHACAINLCRNRVNFFYALTSVIYRGQCNLLPANAQSGTIASLREGYADSYILHDGHSDLDSALPMVDIRALRSQLDDNAAAGSDIHKSIAPDQLAAVSFTSGSTGESRPNNKSWSMLLDGARINAENMLIGASPGLNILATVPAQHMYGLELTITLPLLADVVMHGGQPLYPDDVLQALRRMSAPRALVSTPQHLRALLASGLDFPAVERVYSATAPLDQSLARQIEKTFCAELTEIYGCSEIGSVARRRTAVERVWTPFSGMQFSSDREITRVSAAHVPQAVELQDHIHIHADGSFELQGRFGDLINVAGKRGSLAQLNQLLLSVPGVIDGVIFKPEASAGAGAASSQRLAALVVGAGVDKKTILNTLRQHVDPVFLPRPILFTDSLPRSENSKLPRQAVLDYYEKLRSPQAQD